MRLKVKVLPANLTDRDGGQPLLPEVKDTAQASNICLSMAAIKEGPSGHVKHSAGASKWCSVRPRREVWWPANEPLPQYYLDLLGEQKKFRVIPRRWVVERTLARLSFQRRPNRDYEVATRND